MINKLSCLGLEKAAEILIENGVNVNAANSHTGDTALMLAAKLGNSNINSDSRKITKRSHFHFD